MIKRIQHYDIVHNQEKAWDTLWSELAAIYNDLDIVCGSELYRAEMPKDIRDALESLARQIERTLFKFEK